MTLDVRQQCLLNELGDRSNSSRTPANSGERLVSPLDLPLPVALVDRLTLGIVVMTYRREILQVNRSANRMLGPQGLFQIRDCHVVAASSSVAVRLDRMMAAARAGAAIGGRQAVTVFPVDGVIVEVAVVPWTICATGEPAVMLLMSDPKHLGNRAEHILMELYELTFKEARLSVLLANDATVSEAARELGIAVSTARNHLHALLRKTGVRRQSELVRCVVAGLSGRFSE